MLRIEIFCSFFGRIEDTITCFRNFLTIRLVGGGQKMTIFAYFLYLYLDLNKYGVGQFVLKMGLRNSWMVHQPNELKWLCSSSNRFESGSNLNSAIFEYRFKTIFERSNKFNTGSSRSKQFLMNSYNTAPSHFLHISKFIFLSFLSQIIFSLDVPQ